MKALHIAAREMKEHILSLRFFLAAMLCFILMVLSAAILAEDTAIEREQLAAYVEPEQYRQITEWADANSLMNGGLRLTRQPPSLRSLIYGLSDLSLIAQIKGGNHVLFVRRPLVGNRVHELFSSFDLLFIAGTLLSLVALVLTHDAIAGERDSGVLRLVLSHSVSRGELLLGKWLGTQAILATIVLPCLAAAALVMGTHETSGFQVRDWPKVAGIAAGVLLYTGVFTSLGLFISSSSQTAKSALISSLCAWGAMVWLVPNLCVHLAAVAVHGDDGRLVQANVNRIRVVAENRGWEEMSRFIEDKGWGNHEWANWNLEWGTWSDAVPRLAGELERPEDREELFSFAGQVMQRQFAPMERGVYQIMANHMQQRHNAVELGIVLSCVSPLAPFTYMLTDMARTGVQDEMHFRSEVRRFKRDLVDYLDTQLAQGRMWKKVDSESFPYFHYDSAAVWGSRVPVYAGVLGLYVVLFLMAAYRTLIRLEP